MGGLFHSFSFLALVALLVCGSVTVVEGQQSCGTSRRRSWRSLSCRERIQFLDAVQTLKDRGIYDEFVYIHWDSGDWSHFVPEFLPWHRWFLWVFEKELQRVSGTCMTVPFWDWERGDSLPIMLKSWTFGRRHREGCVRDGIARDWDPAEPGQRCLWREFDTDWEISRDVEVLSRITNLRDFDDFAQALEGAPHAGVHEFIGGPMSINWSPDDPLFWLHHSSVDRMWTLWQDYRDHDRIRDPQNFRWRHFSSDLDRPLVVIDEGRRRINFNRPGRNRPPTPRELLINVDNPDTFIDVQYVNDTLTRLLLETSSSYRNGGNNPDWMSPAQERVRDVCPDGPWEEEQEQQEEEQEQQEEEQEQQEEEQEQQEEEQEQQEEEQDDEQVEEEPVCREIGVGCGSREDCCSGFCSPTSGMCAQSCFGRGSQCENDEECCSNMCNRFGRCEDTFASVQLNSAQCLEIGTTCESSEDCCSDHCSSRLGMCSMMCLDRGSRCDNSNECCSGNCNRFGRCEGNNLRRSMAEMDVEIKDEPLEFSAPRVRTRWYDLIAAYPDNPARIWEILAKEDCAERAALEGHEIRSASQKWIDTMFKGNNTRVFDCHYTRQPF